MTHQEIIWIVVTATFASTFGVIALLRVINKHTRPPVNTINRSGDIELDYIEPVRPVNTYYPDQFDLINTQFGSTIQNTNFTPSYQSGILPSYQSEILPRYQSFDRIDFIANSPLENIINLDFIIILISILIITLLIKQKYGREKLLLILILILITFIIFKMSSLYAMSILLPFSLFDIDFRDSFEWELKSYRDKPVISHMKLQTLSEDISKLLDSLKDDEEYSMSLSFIPSYEQWKDNKEKVHPLFIDNAIIINKESDPILITQFIMNNLNEKGYFITNWLFKDSSINSMDPIILTVTVAINVII